MVGKIQKKVLQLQKIQEGILESNLQMKSILIENYIKENLFENARYLTQGKLNRFERQVFSQYGEDGIIEEIFNRIGTTNRYFIEFGVENGLECNSLFLIHKEWQGLWIEGNNLYVEQISKTFRKKISEGKLRVLNAFITAESIEQLFHSAGVPKEPDLLSIDIDRNDFYIWDAIKEFKPRVVIIEYNSIFPPGTEFVVEYDAEKTWNGTSYFGASLSSLQKLGEQKGYRLVGCSFAGVNAFFVRNDLVGEKFSSPFTAEHHYEPPRYFLYKKEGHPRGFTDMNFHLENGND